MSYKKNKLGMKIKYVVFDVIFFSIIYYYVYAVCLALNDESIVQNYTIGLIGLIISVLLWFLLDLTRRKAFKYIVSAILMLLMDFFMSYVLLDLNDLINSFL